PPPARAAAPAPAAPHAPPRKPSPSASPHPVNRAATSKPKTLERRRDPLSTSLVLVVIAVVVSAGTAIAFAR
ncbi:hypothetical protein ABZ914_25500, partial [Spirillospora sp. NPDC046719]